MRAAISLTTLVFLLAPGLWATQPALLLNSASPVYKRVPPALAEMLFPSHTPPRLVMSKQGGGSLLTVDRFPYRVSDPASLLTRMKSELEQAYPAITWHWGGVFKHSGQNWSAWEFTIPAAGGGMSAIAVGLPWENGVLVLSLASEASGQKLCPRDIDYILGVVAAQLPGV